MIALGVAQTVPVRGDVAANVAEHIRLAQLASDADVLLFPELSLTGYELDLGPSLAFSEHDARLDPLLDAAASTSTILVVGAPVRLESSLHIGAFILHPDRTIELYTKQRMGAFGESAKADGIVPPAESEFFQSGDRNPLLTIGDRTAAIAICADIGRPAHARAAADRGARVYLASMFVIPSELDEEVAKLQRYAREHAMCVAFANYGGPTGGLASAGRSAIWSERGELVAQLEASGSAVAIARYGADGTMTYLRM